METTKKRRVSKMDKRLFAVGVFSFMLVIVIVVYILRVVTYDFRSRPLTRREKKVCVLEFVSLGLCLVMALAGLKMLVELI